MKIKYLGHACFSIDINNTKLLFDPFITSNPLAKNINIDDIDTNYIFASHGHIDHVEDIPKIYKNQNKVTFISCMEVVQWFKKNYKIERFHPMYPGGNWKFDFGKVYCTRESHASSMPDGTYGGIPMGYVIESDKTFYFAGDTGLHMDMKLIGMFHKLDFAFLPIGGNFTMDIDQVIHACTFIKTKKIFAMHYDTNFMIQINHKIVQEKAKKNGLNLIFLHIGETIEL